MDLDSRTNATVHIAFCRALHSSRLSETSLDLDDDDEPMLEAWQLVLLIAASAICFGLLIALCGMVYNQKQVERREAKANTAAMNANTGSKLNANTAAKLNAKNAAATNAKVADFIGKMGSA
jgi:hypothetical protein